MSRARYQEIVRTGQALSPREKQVVELIAQGKANQEIAVALGLKYGSVKEYLVRIFIKTQVTNRTELAVWAIRQAQQKAA